MSHTTATGHQHPALPPYLIPLVPHVIHGDQQETVNARELHVFLEVRRDFSTWIRGRIFEYDFVSSRDYIMLRSPKQGAIHIDESLIPQNGGIKTGRGGDRRTIEYYLTLSMAKELCMVERNERGRQARLYFIECERRLKKIESEKKSDLTKVLAPSFISATVYDICRDKELSQNTAREIAKQTAMKITGKDGSESLPPCDPSIYTHITVDRRKPKTSMVVPDGLLDLIPKFREYLDMMIISLDIDNRQLTFKIAQHCGAHILDVSSHLIEKPVKTVQKH